MKRSTKAMLLSGLVFPGAGHFYLRRWLEGLLLSGAAAVALYFIMSVAWNAALAIAGEIQAGTVATDAGTITALVEQQLQASQSAANFATMVLTACWVAGIAGSYWQGRKTEVPPEPR